MYETGDECMFLSDFRDMIGTKMKQQKVMSFGSLLKLCPYTHLWQTIKIAVKERRLPASARQGAIIALVGLFCPIFWAAYFRGASRSELIFHATHSGIFVLIGVVLMLVGLARK